LSRLYVGDLTPEMPTALYRIFGAGGEMLYLGISVNPRKRFTEHRREPWWVLARTHTIEWIQDRVEAERKERLAIATENPIWNREHKDPATRMPASAWSASERERLNKIEAAGKAVRAELVEAVRDSLPPHGEQVAPEDRGLITEVVKASEWTRAYVDGIRTGKYGK
jgi:hypothetical protein